MELFRHSLTNTPVLPDLPKYLFNTVTPLSVLPYGSGNTPDIVRDTSLTNDHQWDLDGHSDPCAFQKICCR